MAVSQEQYKNDPTTSTTLNGGIDDTTTSVVVTDGSVFPSSGIFRVRIDNEILKVTARSTNTLTVVRGTEGSSAASHSSGATVTMVLTKLALERVGTVIHGKPGDTFANRPAASEDNEGQIYVPSDGHSFARSEGGVWVPYGPISRLTPPVNGDFAWINQGGAAVASDKDVVVLSEAGNGNTDNARLRKKSAPSTPYTITIAFLVDYYMAKVALGFGLLWRNNGSGNFVTWGVKDARLKVTKWTSATSVNGDYTTVFADAVTSVPHFLRIADDGTNRKALWSQDGQNFFEVHSIGRTDFITADEVGFWINTRNSAAPNIGLMFTLLSWAEG